MSTDTLERHDFQMEAGARLVTLADSRRAEIMPVITANVVLDGEGVVLSEQKFLAFPSSITRESTDVFVGRVLALPGCVSQGTSFDEARASLLDALTSVLDFHRTRGTEPVFELPTDAEMPARCDVFPIHVNVVTA